MMSKAITCDQCGKLIADNDIRIVIHGYTVIHNAAKPDTKHKGYGIGYPQDFCSMTCLAQWAEGQQELLDDYLALVKRREGAGNE
jgi:hypothetical protein